MIDVNTIINFFFYPEPIPKPFALKGYGIKFPEFKKFLSYYQTDEFAFSILDGTNAVSHFYAIRDANFNFDEVFEIVFKNYVTQIIKRFNPEADITINASSDKSILYPNLKWEIEGKKITVDFDYRPFLSKQEITKFINEEFLFRIRKFYQALFIAEPQAGKTNSPSDKDAASYQTLTINLYQNYSDELRSFYFLDVNSLTVDDINMILDHYKKIQQSRFYKFLLKECASNTSILMNLGNIILDRMMFYQTAIYLFMDFPPEIKKDEQAKRITEFFEELEHESRRQQLKTLDFDPSGLLEFRGKAQAKMAVITGNIRFYNQAIKSFWEALRQSSRLSVIKSLYETIGDFALASNNQELFFLSNVVRAVFYSTNLYWWIYGEKIEAYKNCRVEYKNKYNEKVKTLYDIKKIPNFFKSPMLSVEYEEKLRRKGAYGFILSMVPGMMLWLQFSKLVLTKNSPELHEIETDLYFAMKIEQEYYEDPKINDEWTQKAKKIYMEIDKVKAVKELLSSNRLL